MCIHCCESANCTKPEETVHETTSAQTDMCSAEQEKEEGTTSLQRAQQYIARQRCSSPVPPCLPKKAPSAEGCSPNRHAYTCTTAACHAAAACMQAEITQRIMTAPAHAARYINCMSSQAVAAPLPAGHATAVHTWRIDLTASTRHAMMPGLPANSAQYCSPSRPRHMLLPATHCQLAAPGQMRHATSTLQLLLCTITAPGCSSTAHRMPSSTL